MSSFVRPESFCVGFVIVSTIKTMFSCPNRTEMAATIAVLTLVQVPGGLVILACCRSLNPAFRARVEEL